MMAMDELVKAVWHWRVEDGLSWKFCAGILQQDGYDITEKQVKKQFTAFFKMLTGYVLDKECEKCGKGKIIPRKSRYGYFVGCSEFPECKFIGKPKIKIQYGDDD